MKGENLHILAGEVVSEPELKEIGQNKTKLCQFRLKAVGMSSKGNLYSTYHTVKCWGRHADDAFELIREGSGVFLRGVLETQKVEGKDGGKDKYYTSTSCFDFMMLSGLPEVGTNLAIVAGEVVGNAYYKEVGKNSTPLCSFMVKATTGIPGKERFNFLHISAWQDEAVTCKELSAGDKVLAIGEVSLESWEDRDGNQQYKTKITADKITLITWEGEEEFEGEDAEEEEETVEEEEVEDELPF